MSILLAGGAGYIGSHTAVELIKAGYDVVIIDNYQNSNSEVINRIEKIAGIRPHTYEMDVKDKRLLKKVFMENEIDVVIHFAGFKSVRESIEHPIRYYRNNIDTTLALLEIMTEMNCRNIIFSSSATVYGVQTKLPYKEDQGRGTCLNPYGWSKYMMEQIIEDTAEAADLSAVILRYFNPIGADESGLIGEAPKGVPNNLMPYILQVATGERNKLTIFGNDYPTPDGTCRRDYIHVVDLAKGHVKAVEHVKKNTGIEIFNMGTGRPYSVLEVVNTFQKVTGIDIKYAYGERRHGDLPECWADVNKARKILGWKAEFGLEKMCEDAWNWQRNNPNGYE